MRKNAKIVPKRLCRDPQTKYCKGKYGHRGCCACVEFNNGDMDFRDHCTPYLLHAYHLECGWPEAYADFGGCGCET